MKRDITKRSLGLVAALALLLGLVFTVGVTPARAQNADSLLQGLINVNVQDVKTNINDFKVVNIQDVLNKADIDVLNNSINNNTVASNNQIELNNLLRDAKILNKNQIVVGVLSAQKTIFRLTRPAARNKAKKK